MPSTQAMSVAAAAFALTIVGTAAVTTVVVRANVSAACHGLPAADLADLLTRPDPILREWHNGYVAPPVTGHGKY
jgi:hypothetical protein